MNWFYKQKYHMTKDKLVFEVGDKIAVKSKSRNVFFQDGVVVGASEFGIFVEYGKDEYFSIFGRGTQKFIASCDIKKLIRKREKKIKFEDEKK